GRVPFQLGLHGGHQAVPELVDLRCHPSSILPLDRHGAVAATPAPVTATRTNHVVRPTITGVTRLLSASASGSLRNRRQCADTAGDPCRVASWPCSHSCRGECPLLLKIVDRPPDRGSTRSMRCRRGPPRRRLHSTT